MPSAPADTNRGPPGASNTGITLRYASANSHTNANFTASARRATTTATRNASATTRADRPTVSIPQR